MRAGNLAIGFAPYVAECTAVDLEPEMLRVARELASTANAKIEFVESGIEDLTCEPGSFEL